MIEALPLPDASIDVVISNGVLNLSTRKSRVLAETIRVLRQKAAGHTVLVFQPVMAGG